MTIKDFFRLAALGLALLLALPIVVLLTPLALVGKWLEESET